MLFESSVESAIVASLDGAKLQRREEFKVIYDRACEYIDSNMAADTREALELKYPGAQRGDDSQRIGAVVMALAHAYVNEMATAYSSGTTRAIMTPDGEVAEEFTEIYNEELDCVGYDQIMHDVERKVITLKSCGVMFLVDTLTGQVDPQVVLPQDIYPVAHPDGVPYNICNQNAYKGFVIDTRIHERDQSTLSDKRTYTLSLPGGLVVYEGRNVNEIQKVVTEIPHQYTWPQRQRDKNTGAVVMSDQPLQLLTLWHEEKPTSTLIPMFEPAVYTNNREINVIWSMMLDVIRFQGGSTPVKTSMAPEHERVNVPVGVRHLALLDQGETFGYANPGNDYGGVTAFLQTFGKLFGVSMSLSPSDFSAEETSVQSGIAKIIANIPKNRQRRKRIKWFSQLERNLAFPRIASQLIERGDLPDELKNGYYLQIEFRGDDIPMNSNERIAEESHDIKLGLTTPAKILANRISVTVEEAQSIIDGNLGRDATDEDEPKEEPKEEPKDEPKDESPGKKKTIRDKILTKIVNPESSDDDT